MEEKKKPYKNERSATKDKACFAGFATVGVPPGGRERNSGGSVTHHTHDVGQDGAGRADERPHDGQQVVVEQEALGAQCPARVAVEHCDNHRHVSAPNGRCQGDALSQTHTHSVTIQVHTGFYFPKEGGGGLPGERKTRLNIAFDTSWFIWKHNSHSRGTPIFHNYLHLFGLPASYSLVPADPRHPSSHYHHYFSTDVRHQSLSFSY